MDSTPVTRRDFVAGSATVALGALVSPPMIVPRHVLGRGYQAPSDTLNIAYIGAGGMGMSNWSQMLTERTVAICDVDMAYVEKSITGRNRQPGPMVPPPALSPEDATAWVARRTASAEANRLSGQKIQEAYTKAAKYADYREMLDKQKDIDAIVVATPDHMHAMIALRAMQAKKHVYVQKPLTYSVMEARALRKAATDTKVVTQMGNQGHSSDGTRRIKEIVASGVLGTISDVYVWTDRPHGWWPQGVPRPTPATPATPPATLNWDLFVGAVPMVPYDPAYHPFAWRGWVDFGVSAIGDMGAHLIDQPFWALELGMPTSIAASSTRWGGDQKTPSSYPLSTTVEYEFAPRSNRPGVKLHWYDGGILPHRPAMLPDDVTLGGDGGGIFVGSKGMMLYGTYGANPRVYPTSLQPDVDRVPQTEQRITTSHEMNWVDACKGKHAASSPFEYAAPLTEVMLLGLVALRTGQGKKLLYDGDNMRVTNLPEANAYLTREYRAGWSL
ncbi:MAG: Gfo/Idh/MocA family oxidoreductase [Gemmatimonadaceae bacterium]|nr:Gfo/Idh/MocA family oxidoreductase [Gemmatimonadaceae bacterium]